MILYQQSINLALSYCVLIQNMLSLGHIFLYTTEKNSGGDCMTLHDLAEHLSPYFPTSVQKDLKTSIRTLAQALSYPDAKNCPLEACLIPLPDLYRHLERFLTTQEKSLHTIRNTKNNVSRLFRLAETHHAIAPLPPLTGKRFRYSDCPRLSKTDKGSWPADGSHLTRRHWPPNVEAAFVQFSQWATASIVPGRPIRWKKRPSTLRQYENIFSTYFGYLHHQLGIQPVEFDHLFDVTLIEQFIHWHTNEKFQRMTFAAGKIVDYIHSMSVQYRPNPVLADALKALKKRLPFFLQVKNKNDAWISLEEIRRAGLALWSPKSHTALQQYIAKGRSHPYIGYNLASRAGLSLMLQLWVHIPYRQRNMREMHLDQNLYRTDGRWRLRFADEQLKVARKGGRSNTFDLPFPAALVPTLEAYLTTWRPVFTHTSQATEVFLNRFGRPLTQVQLTRTVQRHIYSFTGRRTTPHMIRTIWATEWIRATGDFMTAATMLNDTLETVIRKYAHLRDEGVAENAFEWVQNRVNHH
jgi:Phage integrase family